MIKKIGGLMVIILGLLLLVYSATRSLDFIALTLPPGRQGLAYFGLAALDGGLIAWLLSYLYGSKGGWQRATSFLMILIDLLGAVAMFTLDTLYNTGKSGMTAAMTPDELQTAVLGLSAVIALNIAATVAHALTDPDRLREQAEENAFSQVEDATLKQISKNADLLAAELAPTLAADWIANTRARYTANLGSGRTAPAGLIVDAKSQDITPSQPMRKARTVASLPRQLFKRPVRVARPQPLQAETTSPGELVNVAASDEKKSGGAVLSVANLKPVTNHLSVSRSGSAESDGHPNGQAGGE